MDAKPDRWNVDVYDDETSHWVGAVNFRYKWQARLFHRLLNVSRSHNGAGDDGQ